MQPLPLKIDIVSDVVCPWCVIGYKQLTNALQATPERFDVAIHWHPFELNPRMPPEGQNLREHLAQKYGTTPEQSRVARARLTDLGRSLGFRFEYHDDMRMYNTFSAHQLLHWAGAAGRQTELKLELFAAFFSRGEDISDVHVLASAAGAAGLPENEAIEILEDGRYAQAVRAGQQLWLDRHVQGVPTFAFNDKYLVTGAQEAETFSRLISKLVADS